LATPVFYALHAEALFTFTVQKYVYNIIGFHFFTLLHTNTKPRAKTRKPEMESKKTMKSVDKPNVPIYLNNTGARLLLEGRYDAAGDAFVQALKQVKCLMRKDKTNDRLISSFSYGPLKPISPQNAGKKNWMLELSSHGFVFSNPILVDEADVGCDERRSLLKVFLVIVFNAGLIHHIQSYQVDSATGRSAFQTKALRAYAFAYTILVKERVELSIVFLMAIVNNIGQLHASQGNEIKARVCFRQLLSHLRLYTERCKLKECQSPQDLEGFFQNARGDPEIVPSAP
jgi:hypothetical protein